MKRIFPCLVLKQAVSTSAGERAVRKTVMPRLSRTALSFNAQTASFARSLCYFGIHSFAPIRDAMDGFRAGITRTCNGRPSFKYVIVGLIIHLKTNPKLPRIF
jgi:hypothetical protein